MELVEPAAFRTPALRQLYSEMLNAWDEEGEVQAGALCTHLDAAARRELDRVLGHMELPADQAAPGTEAKAALLKELAKFGAEGASAEVDTGSAEALALLPRKKGRNARRPPVAQ